MDTLLAALPLLLHRFRPDLLHVLDVLDGAAVALLFFVFCVCLYVTLVYSLFGWPLCRARLIKAGSFVSSYLP